MSERMIKVESLMNGSVSLRDEERHKKYRWNSKGMIKKIPFENLQDLLYEDGVQYMFTHGLLGIDNMQDKVDLGLEEPEVITEQQEPQILELTEGLKNRLIGASMDVEETKEYLKKASKEQKDDLARYMIETQKYNPVKAKLLEEATGINILQAMQLNQDK